MTDLEQVEIEHVERGVPKATRLRNRTNQIVVVVLSLACAASLLIAGRALYLTGQVRTITVQIRAGQDRSQCRTQLQADFESAVGEALNAPPAPNPLRDQAVQDIKTSADRLKRSADICP